MITTRLNEKWKRQLVPIANLDDFRLIGGSIDRNQNTYFDSAGSTLVFSVEDVFSYKVVDRRGIIPLLGPTVRFPFDGSNFEVALLLGFTGLARAAK